MKKLDIKKYIVKPHEKVNLAERATYDTQGWSDAKMKKRIRQNQEINSHLQEKLFAEDKRSILLVFQAMDAGGKDSTIKSITKLVNPAGVKVSSFKAPTEKEKDRDFLWRIHDKMPNKWDITIFNRSHYEDVIITRARKLVSREAIEKRYSDINAFEKYLSHQGIRVVKFMLHISKEYQYSRFERRLSIPEKWWKFSKHDLEERKLWGTYMDAFEIALSRCSKKSSPWYVIPAENKKFRCMIVWEILRKTLEDLDPQYPEPSFDPDVYNVENLHWYA